MKKLIKISGLILIIITISRLSFGKANEPDSLKIIADRLNSLENYKADLRVLYETSTKELNIQINRELNSAKAEVTELKKKYDVLVYYGLPGTLIALCTLIYSTRKYVKKEIESKISDIVNQKRQDIINLIHEHQIENKIKNDKKILVLSPSDTEEEILRKFFRDLKFNFSNLTFEIVNEYVQFPAGSLIVFNKLSSDIIKEYLQNSSDSEVFVAYTTENIERSSKLNYSNSAFTLYTRIIETIKYKDYLES